MKTNKKISAILSKYSIPNDSSITVNGRNVLYNSYTEQLYVGAKNFDRWSVSTELTFELWKKSGLRDFERWVENNLDLNDPSYSSGKLGDGNPVRVNKYSPWGY